ncbi:hypothetical protein [Salinibacter ruber]|uniref:hypothetical protein n=1 Tax=Salinibacter ruber TaxID=146919 RepID=UPI002168A22E|nr:hypothetical protein [Salinibacter ruber]MCS4195570.1 hypothetical protein [Salinibacter ruber]
MRQQLRHGGVERPAATAGIDDAEQGVQLLRRRGIQERLALARLAGEAGPEARPFQGREAAVPAGQDG